MRQGTQRWCTAMTLRGDYLRTVFLLGVPPLSSCPPFFLVAQMIDEIKMTEDDLFVDLGRQTSQRTKGPVTSLASQ